MALHLSKSKYCMAVQCPKMLWLKSHMPELFDDSVMNQAVLDTGTEVGDLAMGLLGPYTEVEFGDLSKMVTDTRRLLEEGVSVITEASFSYHGLFCSVDLLKVVDQKTVELYEVKSSTEISDIYYHDAAYQYYVLTNLGFQVQKVCLVHIDKTYVRQGALDIEKLFKINDITDAAKQLYSDVDERIRLLSSIIQDDKEPAEGLDMHCFQPYPCGFFSYCSKDLPSPNVFNIAGMQTKSKVKYYKRGLSSFEDLEHETKLNLGCLMQIDHELHDIPDYIDRKSIHDFLNGLSYPLYFLDFESYQSAIPLYDNSKPYEQIVFQYSLHYIEREDGTLKHKEYLAYPGEDPRRKLAERLCSDIPENCCVLAYNMSFEKGRIKGLAELYPDLKEKLLRINTQIQDLMVPFRQKLYYTRAMQGSYSIKYVLPALFPDDPSLNYHNLEEIHNGAEASSAFIQMQSMNPDQIEQYRDYLLKYCGLDTFAMVKIWEKLLEVSRL